MNDTTNVVSLRGAREFECIECKDYIYTFGYDDFSNLCALCRWLREQPITDEEKQMIRKLLTARRLRDERLHD